MLRPDAFEPDEFQRTIDNLDERIVSAVDRQYRQQGYTAATLGEAFNELGLLRSRPNARLPNYSVPGVEIAYALKYLPTRTLSIAGSLSLKKWSSRPRLIADLGSGCGATVLALELFAEPNQYKCFAFESASNMTSFARKLYATDTAIVPQAGGIEAFARRLLPRNRTPDLVILSACLGYAWDNGQPQTTYSQIVEKLANQRAYGMNTIAIEPDNLESELRRLRHSLGQRNAEIESQIRCCHEFASSSVIRSPIRLSKCSDWLSDLFSSIPAGTLNERGERCLGSTSFLEPFPVTSWNGTYRDNKDKILVAEVPDLPFE